MTSDGSHTNATYYNDVRVPADMRVGEENQGWRLITTQLNHERMMLGPAGRIEGLRDMVVDWARDRTTPTARRCSTLPAIRDTLARATAAFRVNELLNWQVAGYRRDRARGRRRRVGLEGVRLRRGAVAGAGAGALVTRTATRRTRRPRGCAATSTRPRSGTSCSPSAAGSTRCSAS